MLPIYWMTETMRVMIRTGLVMAELQKMMVLRFLALPGIAVAEPVGEPDSSVPVADAGRAPVSSAGAEIAPPTGRSPRTASRASAQPA